MKREIGSFFEAYEIPLETSTESLTDSSWLDITNIQLVCSGREAIEAALIDIQNRNPGIRKVCMLPQYTCDTVVIPFQKHGWEICFYPIARNLTVNCEKFEVLLVVYLYRN